MLRPWLASGLSLSSYCSKVGLLSKEQPLVQLAVCICHVYPPVFLRWNLAPSVIAGEPYIVEYMVFSRMFAKDSFPLKLPVNASR